MKTLPPHYNQTSVSEIMDEQSNAVKGSVGRGSYICRRIKLYFPCSNIKFGNADKESNEKGKHPEVECTIR